MKKLIAILAVSLLSLRAFATISIDVGAADLRDNNGVLMPTNGLVLLVADTLSNGFVVADNLLGASIASASSFLKDDDWIIWRAELDSGFGEGYLLQTAGNLILTNGWGVGDPIALYWFPTLTLTDTTVPAGIWHGWYTTNVAIDTTTPPGWFTPGDGAAITLNLVTESQGGSSPNSMGYANYFVPEPSALALVGMGLAAMWLMRRYRR